MSGDSNGSLIMKGAGSATVPMENSEERFLVFLSVDGKHVGAFDRQRLIEFLQNLRKDQTVSVEPVRYIGILK